jgi:hypothetical protein
MMEARKNSPWRSERTCDWERKIGTRSSLSSTLAGLTLSVGTSMFRLLEDGDIE